MRHLEVDIQQVDLYLPLARHLQHKIILIMITETDAQQPTHHVLILLRDCMIRRHTVMLEGCWTGIDHLGMVRCHQLQVWWRFARAALELGTAMSVVERGVVLDAWLRNRHTVPPLATHMKDALHPTGS